MKKSIFIIAPILVISSMICKAQVSDYNFAQMNSSDSGVAKTSAAADSSGIRNVHVISGIRNIPGSYATIAAAVADLNISLIGTGGVTFNVAAGYSETTTSSLLITATGDVDHPIVFQKSGSGANPVVTRTDTGTVCTTYPGYDGDGIIIIDGSDYVTFNGIDVTATDQRIEYGYYLRHLSATDGCSHVTIINASINMTKGSNIFVAGICASNNRAGFSDISITTLSGRHDNITINGNVISNTFNGIFLKGYINMRDQNFMIGSEGQGNTIQNFAGYSSSMSNGIYLDAITNISIGYNTIHNMDGGGSAFSYWAAGIYSLGGVNGDFTIEHNDINLTSESSTLMGIYNYLSYSNLNINHNTISVSNTSPSGSMYGFIVLDLLSTLHSNNTNIKFNTFASSTINTNYNTYLIYNNNKQQSPAESNVEGNTTSGTISMSGNGTFYAYYNVAAATGEENIYDNNFSDMTCSGPIIFYGIYSATSTGHTQNVYNNTISNIEDGSGAIYAINLDKANTREVYGNTIDSLSGNGNICGIFLGEGSNPGHIYGNNLFDFTSTATGGPSGSVCGILVHSGTAVYIYNNFISDLKAPNLINTDAIWGISITSSLENSMIGVYYNTIYLDATSGSIGFGNSGIFHNAYAQATTAALDLRNNIVVNNSTPQGNSSYLAVAFRSGGSLLDNYLSTSNNNIFYAGVPASNHLIFWPDCQTIDAFKTFVGPNRDSLSYSEMPPFVNIATPPYDLRLRDDSVSYCESGARPITTPLSINTDFDDTVRGTTPDIGADEFNGVSPFGPKIPEDAVIPSQTIGTGKSQCFNAYQTITVAGSGSTVFIESGGSAEFIAGHSISFLPDFQAESGSSVHAAITTDSTFCDGALGSSIVYQPIEKSKHEKSLPDIPSVGDREKSVKVYPNPNNGQFTLELTNIESSVWVGVYNTLGVKVYQFSAKGNTKEEINLTNIQTGIYFVRVNSGKDLTTSKIIIK
jgi:hypothetical protein